MITPACTTASVQYFCPLPVLPRVAPAIPSCSSFTRAFLGKLITQKLPPAFLLPPHHYNGALYRQVKRLRCRKLLFNCQVLTIYDETPIRMVGAADGITQGRKSSADLEAMAPSKNGTPGLPATSVLFTWPHFCPGKITLIPYSTHSI